MKREVPHLEATRMRIHVEDKHENDTGQQRFGGRDAVKFGCPMLPDLNLTMGYNGYLNW